MFTRMSNKRTASTELNHENWDKEEHIEEAGTFQKAPTEVIERRVVKRAKRRLQASEDSTRSAFSTLTSFKTTSPISLSQAPSPFSFLANSNVNPIINDPSSKTITNISKPPANNETSKNTENGTNKKEKLELCSSITPANTKGASEQENQNIFKKSSDYYAKLKGLNESVAQWIKTHVDANPFCILTPIFKDYERYLKEIVAKHGNEIDKTAQASEQSQSVHISDKKETISTDKKLEISPFGEASTKSPFSSTEWKPEKSIFGNTNAGSKSIFTKSEQTTTDSSKSIFSSPDQTSDTHKSVFGNIDMKTSCKSIFGSVSSEKNPFLSKSPASDNKSDQQETKSDSKATATTTTSNNNATATNSSFTATTAPTFCFGQGSTLSNSSTGFSFGSAKPFTFGAQVVKPQESEDAEGKNDEDEQPPKAEFKPVTEEGATYSQRCKVFIKKDAVFTDRGVGTLFLKPTPNNKTQLLIRADTSLGNLLLNTLLTESIPTKRMSKNTIVLVCLPKPESAPPPVPVLLRVKTSEDADALLEALTKHKK